MVEEESFLPNLKHRYRVSQQGEDNYSAYNKKKGNCYEYPSFSFFMDEH